MLRGPGGPAARGPSAARLTGGLRADGSLRAVGRLERGGAGAEPWPPVSGPARGEGARPGVLLLRVSGRSFGRGAFGV